MTGETGDQTAVTTHRGVGWLAGRIYEKLLGLGGLAVAIVIVAVIFQSLEPSFLTTNVMVSMLRSMSSIAILALGLTLVIVIGEIDLSFGATYGFAANTMAALWLLHGWGFWPSLAAGLASTLVIGLVNGLLVTLFSIPSFIVTLGAYNLIYGLSLYVGQTYSLSPAYPPAGAHVSQHELGIFQGLTRQLGSSQFSLEIAWMLGLALLVGFVLHRSLFGFRLTAIGGNAEAARLTGLPVRRYKVIAFIACALLAGVAGILDFSFSGSVSPDAGLASTFAVFAAVVIGGASLAGGRGSIIGTMGGALLLAVLTTGLALVASGPFTQQMFLGAVTIGAVMMDVWTRKTLSRRSRVT